MIAFVLPSTIKKLSYEKCGALGKVDQDVKFFQMEDRLIPDTSAINCYDSGLIKSTCVDQSILSLPMIGLHRVRGEAMMTMMCENHRVC